MTKTEQSQVSNQSGVKQPPVKAMVGTPLAVLNGVSFSTDSATNWSKSLSWQPEATFYPRTLEDLQVIVREAKKQNKTVRCSGTGHSWCSTSVTQDFLVSVNSMNKIHKPQQSTEDGQWTVKIEMGVTIEELDVFLRQNDTPLALATNVLIDDVRYGGVLTMGCHGPMFNFRTLSDLITELTIVNANGDLVTYSENGDPAAFSAACLNLGLLGIIYTATMRVEPMTTRLLMKDLNPTLESVFGSADGGIGLSLKKLALENVDGFQLFHWPFKQFKEPEQNDRVWVKTWKRTNEALSKKEVDPKSVPEVDHPLFKTFAVGEQVLDTPDALHYEMGGGGSTATIVGVAIKVDEDFKNIAEAFTELNWAFSTSSPERRLTILEMRFVKASNKLMSPMYDEDSNAIYCMMSLYAISGTPGFKEYSKGIAENWIKKYNG
ncbi:D-arabinono-1,4-lactone oxidase, partial [Dissophora globulifera]